MTLALRNRLTNSLRQSFPDSIEGRWDYVKVIATER
jgi:hypothetical protein